MTCFSLIYALYTFSGGYNYEPVSNTIWYLGNSLAISASLWVKVAKKKKNLSKRWARSIQTVLLITVCILTVLLIAPYLLLL